MSNKLTIQATIFQNVNATGKTYGVRVYDDYGKAYINTFDFIPDDDLELLQMVVDEHDEDVEKILSAGHGENISINDTDYEWDDVKHILG